MRLRLGSLFSGYGGLDHAAADVFGASVAWVSDIDPGACKILAHRYPDVPNLGDITTVDWSAVEPVDIITGGSPCQDLSHAGRRAGMSDGTRSNLWVAMREAIATMKPAYVIWENVSGALSASADSGLEHCPGCMGSPGDGGAVLRALGRVLGDLADLGFDADWHGVRASDLGACHHRFRVFVVAHAYGQRHERPRPAWDGRAGLAHGDSPAVTVLPTPRATRGGSGTETMYGLGGQRSNDGRPQGEVLLPTPSVADAMGGHASRSGARSGELLLPGLVKTFLPTPRASDGTKGGPNQRGSSGDLMLPSAVCHLPTPSAADGNGGGRMGSPGHQTPLPGAVREMGTDWGQYAPAIARHERFTGRPAPAPTATSPKGGQRLSPAFVEWMMGLPAGWVTDTPGLTRNEALKALGNGVVPQQAAHALRVCLSRAEAIA